MVRINQIFIVAVVALSCCAACVDTDPLDAYGLALHDGNVEKKTENKLAPEVRTEGIPKIWTTSVDVKYTVKSAGRSESITESGVVWSTSPDPTLETGQYTRLSGYYTSYYAQNYLPQTFDISVSRLTEGTKYYLRAYAKNEKAVGYGNVIEFETVGIGAPSVVTDQMTSIWTTKADVRYLVNDSGNAEKITESGVVWSTSQNPTLETGQYTRLSGYYTSYYARNYLPQAFDISISGLTEGTKYYLRAFAKNEKSVGYGDVITFTTVGIVAPSVITGKMTSVGTTTAEARYTVNDSGNAEKITESGVVWSTSQNPTLETGNYTRLSGYYTSYYARNYLPQTFSVSISGLKAGTKYYLRAYAKNEKTVGYGDVITFTSNTR